MTDRPRPAPSWRQAFAVVGKDLRVELRSRTAVNAILLFSVTALAVVGFAAGPETLPPSLKAALLWIVLFFAAFSGLAHVFTHEEDAGTAAALRLSATAGAVYAGKLLFNTGLLAVMAAVVTPLFLVMLRVPVPNPAAFAAVVVSGCVGLASAATIVAAIIARARSRGALYGAVGFPVLLPLLMIAVSTTRHALMADPAPGALTRGVAGLVSFAVMLTAASALLFPYAWED